MHSSSPNPTRLRRSRFGIGLIAVSMILSSCGGGDDEAQIGGPPPDTADPAETAVAIADQFDQALRALNGRYEFTTSVDAQGAVVSRLAGRNVDGNTTSTATVAAITIDVIGVGLEFWTRTGSGAWVPAAGAPASQDPLAALLAVTEVTFFEGALTLTYPGAALGLNVDWVTAEVSILGPSVELVAVADGLTGRTSLSPASDLTAITAPA